MYLAFKVIKTDILSMKIVYKQVPQSIIFTVDLLLKSYFNVLLSNIYTIFTAITTRIILYKVGKQDANSSDQKWVMLPDFADA